MNRVLTIRLILLPLCGLLQGQSQEVTTHDAPVDFTVKTNLVLVRVLVRDSNGKAVGTLQKENFQLFDKGKPQVISKFSVENSESLKVSVPVAPNPLEDGKAAEAPVKSLVEPDRFLAFLFDDVHLTAEDLYRVREAAARHLTESLAGNSRAAVYTTSGQVRVDFTEDYARLRDGLLQLRSHVQTRRGTDCPDLSVYQADLILNKKDQMALQDAAKEALGCVAGVVPFEYAVQIALQAARRVLNESNQDTEHSFDVLKDVLRRIASGRGHRQVIVVSPGFLVTSDYLSEQADVIDQAIRANVMLSALDARGLYAVTPGGDRAKMQFEKDSAMSNGDVLEDLTASTGGVFFHNNNDLDAGFQRVASPPEYEYLLGFSPQNLKLDGAYHALKVSLKGSSGMTALSRRGYFAPRHELDPAQESKRAIEEALYSRDELHDLPVKLRTQFFMSNEVSAKLTVLAQVDVKGLRFKKAAGLNQNTLTIVYGLFDRNGNLLSSVGKAVDMKLKDETVAVRLAASGITIKNTFDVTSGSYFIRLVVRDAEGRTMSALNSAVEIP